MTLFGEDSTNPSTWQLRQSFRQIADLKFQTADRLIRYEVHVELDTSTEKLHVEQEKVELRYSVTPPLEWPPSRQVLIRASGSVHFNTEATGFYESTRKDFHRNFASINSLPSDADFPATAWLREQLRGGIKSVLLDLDHLRHPSPPATTDRSDMKGSSLARSIAQLRSRHAVDFSDWMAHVRTVLPDVKDIRTDLKEADRHRYVVIDYQNGVSVPSWMLSDGTLRLLALTILAYLPDFTGVYLGSVSK